MFGGGSIKTFSYLGALDELEFMVKHKIKNYAGSSAGVLIQLMFFLGTDCKTSKKLMMLNLRVLYLLYNV